METHKWIWRTRRHFIIFAVACVISNIGFWMNNISSYRFGYGIGIYGMLLWALNPLPLIYSLTGLKYFLAERKDPDNSAIIGKDWVVLPIVLEASIVLYWFSALIMVALTGGA